MQVFIILLCLIGGYLIGSVSLSRFVTHIVAPGVDLEKIELPDSNTGGVFELKTVGATTASMVVGPKIGGVNWLIRYYKRLIAHFSNSVIFSRSAIFLDNWTSGSNWPYLAGLFSFSRRGRALSRFRDIVSALILLGLFFSVFLAMIVGMFILHEISFIVMGAHYFYFWIAIRTVIDIDYL